MDATPSRGVVGADAIFACLGPALEVFSRYSRVEKASGETISLKEYLEQVWAAVSKEALAMIFSGADATGFEEDARLTAMWLWTLSTAASNGNGASPAEDEQSGEDEEDESVNAKGKVGGFVLEYDAARKIAQGLGAHLEQLSSLVEAESSGSWGDAGAPHKGETVLDRVHQSMILFGAGRGGALKRFLVNDGAGRDDRF
jgi:putative DNA methylase